MTPKLRQDPSEATDGVTDSLFASRQICTQSDFSLVQVQIQTGLSQTEYHLPSTFDRAGSLAEIQDGDAIKVLYRTEPAVKHQFADAPAFETEAK